MPPKPIVIKVIFTVLYKKSTGIAFLFCLFYLHSTAPALVQIHQRPKNMLRNAHHL